MGLATSTPFVDQAVGEGSYLGRGRLGLVFTKRTEVILRPLFSSSKGSAGTAAAAPIADAERKCRRFIGSLCYHFAGTER